MVTKEEGAEVGLGRVFLKELVRASSWGIMTLVVVTILLIGGKQNIKEAIDFTFKRAIGETLAVVYNPLVKQDVKEAIEFLSQQSSRQARYLLADPALKQDIKEAIDLWYAYKYKKIEPTGKLADTP
jgi:hypothetical protein